MLGKLLKYEVKATARTFLPFYIALIAMALINKLFFWINSTRDFYEMMDRSNSILSNLAEIPAGLALMGFVGIIVAVFVVTVFVMIQRFYKNLLGDEGYLMFTLPVKPWQNILSKLAVSTMWLVVSTIATAIAIFITAVDSNFLQHFPSEFATASRIFFEDTGMTLGLVITEFIILSVVSLVVSILHVYISIALGQLFNTHKLLASFGAYFVINIVRQAINSIAMVIFGTVNSNVYDQFAAIQTLQSGAIMAVLISIVYGVVFYIGTNWLLSKKLNLE